MKEIDNMEELDSAEIYRSESFDQMVKNCTDGELRNSAKNYTDNLIRTNYIKNFCFLGVPIIQYPTDLMVLQELIWRLKPALIIETGAAFLGQTLFLAGMQKLVGNDGNVLSIDIEFKEENIKRAEQYWFFGELVTLIQESSTHPDLQKEIEGFIDVIINRPKEHIMVILDSNHTEEHVLKELEMYSKFVTVGSYIIVNDTSVEQWADKYPPVNRPWGKGNNPMTAVNKFLKDNDSFITDWNIEGMAGITGCPGGWLKRMK